MAKSIKSKEAVKLRERDIRSGGKTLYLDIYINGKREYEYLRLYLKPEKNKADKEANKKTLQLANAIKAQRLVEIQSGRFNFRQPTSSVLFFDYFLSLANQKKAQTSKESWLHCYNYMRMYEKRQNIKISDIDSRWVKGFRTFLDKRVNAWDSDKRKNNRPQAELKSSTKALYFQKLVACLNQAVKDELIQFNPAANAPKFDATSEERVYLTIDEVRLLSQTESQHPELRRAFLFSCLTGLRWSDIVALKWSNLRKENNTTRIIFTQQKTRNLEYLDISEQASALLDWGDHNPRDAVFRLQMSGAMANYNIRLWAAAAGIKKHITFHTGRHTFATMMLTLGTDIYTVSKLLGHRDLKTTQIYAEIIDHKKRDAVNNIPSII